MRLAKEGEGREGECEPGDTDSLERRGDVWSGWREGMRRR